MASVSFDGPNLLITVDPEAGSSTSITAVEIYLAWKTWVLAGNANFLPAFGQSVGGETLGPGVSLDAFVFIRTDLGWRIRPDERDHTLSIDGNLYASDPSSPIFVPTVGEFTVPIERVLSSRAQAVETGSGSTVGGGVIDPDFESRLVAHIWAASRLTGRHPS